MAPIRRKIITTAMKVKIAPEETTELTQQVQ